MPPEDGADRTRLRLLAPVQDCAFGGLHCRSEIAVASNVQEEIGGGLTHREESFEESAFEGIECGPVVGSLASEVTQIGRQRGDRIGLVGLGRSGENHPTASMQWVLSTACFRGRLFVKGNREPLETTRRKRG